MEKRRPHLKNTHTNTQTHSQLKPILCSNNRLQKQTNIPCSFPLSSPSSSSFHALTLLLLHLHFLHLLPAFLFSMFQPSFLSSWEYCFTLLSYWIPPSLPSCHLLLISLFFPSPTPSSSSSSLPTPPSPLPVISESFHYHTPEEFNRKQTHICTNAFRSHGSCTRQW